jgi:hypothetical protein
LLVDERDKPGLPFDVEDSFFVLDARLSDRAGNLELFRIQLVIIFFADALDHCRLEDGRGLKCRH